MRVTIVVHDHRTHKSYRTRAFPTAEGSGLFSAALGLDSETHWVHVRVGDQEAEVLGADKVSAPTFQLRPVHQSYAPLINGTALVEYDVAKRYHISVNVQRTLH